ncbi:protein phosphatase 2C domain-containing protein [Falsibacillus albus]|uniref:Protein phosphatase 2C domain-containing protein n=1 Tax=Falsibacillus albus TaxID=2478915 RepID=A0A3L7JZV7_9BACI|nr:protein phosphatase 2C domain-containing protein [Falsibacillus albus]RLQ96327.1 protein phosphatase 2C domain-containing protein [Falsibacillus albus]
MNRIHKELDWVGSREPFVDQPDIQVLDQIAVGRYGGNSSSGQYKNEDGCLVWQDGNHDWELAVILDAHMTAESAEIVIEQIKKWEPKFQHILTSSPSHTLFKYLEVSVLNMFQDQEFLSKCRSVQGETACLIVVRKDKYLWWFSIGDCVLYMHHPDLTVLGQYQVNQRQFFEWVGQVNTFELDVPCYSCGTKELRKGSNHIFMTTDGLIECPRDPYSHPSLIFREFNGESIEKALSSIFSNLQDMGVRDSTTIVTWKVEIEKEASIPSDV